MVAIHQVISSNERFAREHKHDAPPIMVFAGATSGIGAKTLERMMTMYEQSTIYVLGRSLIKFQASQRGTLEALNPGCTLRFIETDVSLISGIDVACKEIKAREGRVDYLYMSMGGLPLAGAEYTREGLELCMSLSYYARLRLLDGLMPLLQASPRPRVLSVLNGGKETWIDENDVGLDNRWSLMRVVGHTTLMTSLAFDRIANFNSDPNSNITLVHNAPGLVESDNIRRNHPPQGAGLIRRFWLATMKWVFTFIRYIVGMSPEEAGERQTYHLTSDDYGPGSLRVDQNSEVVPNNKAMRHYAERAWGEKLWEQTLETWARGGG